DVNTPDKPLEADFTLQSQKAATEEGAAKPQADQMKDAREAVSLLDAGKVDEAIVAFQKALTTHPDSASIHYDLGVAYEKKNRAEDAQKEYLQAIKLKPDLGEALLALGNS